MRVPLAAKLRPHTIDHMVGQQHLIGEGMPIRKILESGIVPNMIFYGPPGVGKTTLAHMIADSTGRNLYKLNATTASSADVKEILAELNTLAGENGIVLYLDEIQYFTKKQQQLLLDFVENGSVTLIASTAENPYFYVYGAIISRSTVFEFKPVSQQDMEKAVARAFAFVSEEAHVTVVREPGVDSYVACCANGDVRKAMNLVELLCLAKPGQKTLTVTLEDAGRLAPANTLKYDRDGDQHYDLLSAFQKSLRGSDPDAAIHYMSRILKGGDMPSVCRRLLVTAAEDVGLAYPQILPIVKACVDSANQLGMPEARIPLADAVILVATSPKSNSGIVAIDRAFEDLDKKEIGEIPAHLKDAHYAGAQALGHGVTYRYPHAFPGGWICQDYLPEGLRNAVYYEYGSNRAEQAAKTYWDGIKHEKKK